MKFLSNDIIPLLKRAFGAESYVYNQVSTVFYTLNCYISCYRIAKILNLQLCWLMIKLSEFHPSITLHFVNNIFFAHCGNILLVINNICRFLLFHFIRKSAVADKIIMKKCLAFSVVEKWKLNLLI